MKIGTCVACSAQKLRKSSTIEGYVAGDHYTVLICDICGTHMTNPHRSEDRVYEWIYANRKSCPGYSRYAQYAEEVLSVRNPLRYLSHREEMYYGVAKEICKTTPKGGTILDIGCGLGYFTYALVRDGYNAKGIDIAQEAISNARSSYGDNFICGDFFSHNPEIKYDVVCMLELIEHVDNPHAYISHAKSLLKPGGKLIMTTPNRSWFPDSDIWNTDLPPVHITWFSEKGARDLLLAHNLTPRFFNYTWYNIRYGTISKPFAVDSVRTPIFSRDGIMLVTPYQKSHIRKVAEQLHMYAILKGSLEIVRKLKDYIRVARNPSLISLRHSGTICVSAQLR